MMSQLGSHTKIPQKRCNEGSYSEKPRYRLAGERLELLDGTGGVILIFESQPAVP